VHQPDILLVFPVKIYHSPIPFIPKDPSQKAAPVHFLDKDRITAPPSYNRWLIPPAALSVYLCIGQVFAFSVFNEPSTCVQGVSAALPDDWTLSSLGGFTARHRTGSRRVGCRKPKREEW
jgi:hypothetical protein